ncbi:site-2 protease family protein [Anaerovorax odorimutans]|uniref:site-2 protease family protein n=1 Tax=Anaerovorax odorimutans TaxID=109327 RepID=UPI0003FFFB3E|nr:site-2 protease family protein [Anaerovorax odorimutans]
MRYLLNNPVAMILIALMAANSFLSGRFENPADWFMNTLILLPAIIIGLSFHEFAHAKVSNILGDDLPELQGRVTINPKAHIDPIGFIALLFVGFGWGKPVQINPQNYKKPRRDELLVAIAGVTMNLILAVLFIGIFRLLVEFQYEFITETSMGSIISQMIYAIIQINIVLMIFNLLPIPPLDGFNIVTQIFNLRNTQLYYQIYDKGFIILLLLIIFNITDKILIPAVNIVWNLLWGIFF